MKTTLNASPFTLNASPFTLNALLFTLYSLLFTLYSLPLTLFGGVTAHKAPLKSLLIDNASVVTNVTGTDAATKLESADGATWLDVDGVKRQRRKKAEWDGFEAYSELQQEVESRYSWFFPMRAGRSMSLMFFPPDEWAAQLSREEEVEDSAGNLFVDTVVHNLIARAPENSSSVLLKSDDGFQELVYLAEVVSEIDRFATVGEVDRIASGISKGLTTNDVCAIVTNTVESGWSEWKVTAIDNAFEEFSLGYVRWIDNSQAKYGGFWAVGLIRREDGFTVGDSDAESPKTANKLEVYSGLVILERTRLQANALGLAMAKDVVPASVVTNIVRDNIGTIWDDALGVAWQARMHNGHLYYIATTNQPPEVK